MARHKLHLVIPCSEPGCNDAAWRFEFDDNKEYAETYREYSKRPQYCSRHKNKSEVLTPQNTEVQWHGELTAKNADPKRYPSIQDKNFWYDQDGGYGSGVIHGEHWSAWAQEFPIGTRIVIDVVARAILPDKELT